MQTEAELADLSRPALVALVLEATQALDAARARITALEAELGTLRQRSGRGGGPPKTPQNSSLPPSKGWKATMPTPEPGGERLQPGGQPGHPGVSRLRVAVEDVDVVVPCRPAVCSCCGAGLPTTGGRVVGQRQVTELPPVRPVVVQAEQVAVRCPDCGQETVGAYPAGFGATGRFGPRVAALATWLHEEHHLAYARLVEVFAGAFGLGISEGAVVEAVGRVSQALGPDAAAIGEAVRAAPVVGSDETGARVAGQSWWEWVFQTRDAAYHTVQPKRDTAVVLRFLDGAQPQVWVSDLWKPQLAAPAARYQICLAHQLRELAYARQAAAGLSREWARAMTAVLGWVIRLWHQRAAQDVDPADAAQRAAIERACARLLAQPLPPGWSADLQRRFQTHRAGLLTCLDDPRVEPTNNASERSLRPGVVHRKVTGGFRSEAGAQGYATVRTVLETARKRGEALFATLLRAAGPSLPVTSHYALVPT